MNIKKHIQLTTEPLEYLITNRETVDFRLDESTWEKLVVGDMIEFWEDLSGWDKEPSQNARKVVVEILEVFPASSFSELIDDLPESFQRGRAKEDTITDLRQWWTPEKEKQIGVLGWRVALV